MADQASRSKSGTSRRRTSLTRKPAGTPRAKSGAAMRGTTGEVKKIAANAAATPSEPAAPGYDQFLSMGQEMMSSWFDLWTGGGKVQSTDTPAAFGPLASVGPQMMTHWLDAWSGGQGDSSMGLPGPDAFFASNPMLAAWRDAWSGTGQADQALPGFEQLASTGQQMMTYWLDAWSGGLGGQESSSTAQPGPPPCSKTTRS